MRVLPTIVLVALALLSGCASIPLTTALRLSALTPRDLAQVDPAQVRVRISIPDGYELNVPATRLTLALSSSAGEMQSAEMGLSLIQRSREYRSTGLFSADLAVSTYVLALTPEGAQRMQSVQHFVLAKDPSKFKFGVSAPLAKLPPNAREMTFWADVRLSAHDQYIPIIDAATIKFVSSGTGAPALWTALSKPVVRTPESWFARQDFQPL